MVIINKESEIWSKIIKPKYPLYKQRIECKGVGDGTPDIMLIKKDKRNFFIEAKAVDKIIQKGNFHYIKPKIRPSQIRWFLQYPNEACFLIIVKDIQKLIIIDKRFTPLLNEGKFIVFPEKDLLNEEEMLQKILNYGF